MRAGRTRMYAWCVGIVYYKTSRLVGVQLGRSLFFVALRADKGPF